MSEAAKKARAGAGRARPAPKGARQGKLPIARAAAPPRSHHYHVYVVELGKDVLYEARFRRCNPQYLPGMPCVYVGMTGLDPDTRFDKHKAGLQANRYVREYGMRLLPELYECYNPMPYDGALEMEVELAIALRAKGYGVWQA